jgi:hypothetical protein
MTDELVLSREGCTITIGDRTRDSRGRLEGYHVSLSADQMHATVFAWHCDWAPTPADFFGRLADQWKGWEGEETWKDPEGEWSMTAISDNLGHVRLEVKISPHPGLWPWSAGVSVQLDAGQLEELRQRSAAFFAVETQ